jgi:dethiobiotin synthetase
MERKRIYVAATSQHVGKTTCTLGLVSVLKEKGIEVGYCKPVGQQFVDFHKGMVDKDAFLFADTMGFSLEPHLHSPVILGPGATTDFLDNPEGFNYQSKLIKASKILQSQYEMVIYEGTGHPGVGSVVDLSNADVANLLDAGVIMVVEAGVGNTIDRLTLCLSVFEQQNVPILGVILNKAIPDKMEKVRHYVGQKLKAKGIRLLGVIPYAEVLGLPLMRTVAAALNGKVLFYEENLDNRVDETIAGSLIDLQDLKNFSNLLLVVSISRLGDALNKLTQVCRMMGHEDSPLSGIILTGNGDLSGSAVEYIHQYKIPVVLSRMDTYESIVKLSRIEVKINTRTPWKVRKAVELFREYVDLSPILNEAGGSD